MVSRVWTPYRAEGEVLGDDMEKPDIQDVRAH
jgi:hypothetical protein